MVNDNKYKHFNQRKKCITRKWEKKKWIYKYEQINKKIRRIDKKNKKEIRKDLILPNLKRKPFTAGRNLMTNDIHNATLLITALQASEARWVARLRFDCE